MPRAHNTRRRLLAFLGFVGAPVALWSGASQAQTTAPTTTGTSVSDLMAELAPSDIICSVTLAGSGSSEVYYERSLSLDGDRLSLLPYEDKSRITVTPTKTQYADGFSDGATTSYETFVGSEATQFQARQPETGLLGVFSIHLRADPAPKEAFAILVSSDAQLASDKGSYTMGSTPGTYVIETGWTKTPASILSGPFQVVLSLDRMNRAIFDFDLSATNGMALLKQRSDELEAAEGVYLDADDAVIGVPDCAVAGDASSSDYDPECFFTTAAVGTLGLSDDCWELRTLRAFRDGPLAQTQEGQALTARYYAEAPRIVAGIGGRDDAHRIWLAHYWTHILPCAIMARMGAHRLAIQHYRRLFEKLEDLIKASRNQPMREVLTCEAPP